MLTTGGRKHLGLHTAEIPPSGVALQPLHERNDKCGCRIKFFPRKVRKWQEEYTLQALAASGVVPKLYPYPSEEILVMQRLPGQMLYKAEKALTGAAWKNLYRHYGPLPPAKM